MSAMIVLDSHIWFWWVNGENRRLPSFILAEIEAAPRVGVSPVSCFELALAHQRDAHTRRGFNLCQNK